MQRKRKPGGQPKPEGERKRNNLTFRVRDALRARLEEAAAAAQRSVSEEIEFRLNRDFSWERSEADIQRMRAQAAALIEPAHVQALWLAGLMILRDVEGHPKRVVVDYDMMIAQADGIARGLRSGFFAGDAPAQEPARPMTTEEVQRVTEEIRAALGQAVAKAKPDDDAAA